MIRDFISLKGRSEVKETGIIMSGNHPKLILEGKKTMTRRTWGLKEINENPNTWVEVISIGWPLVMFKDGIGGCMFVKCPYGGVGDRLWCKETWWTPPHNWNRNWREKYLPFETSEPEKNPALVSYKAILESQQAQRQIWLPSIFMPRWASRILLEITELRAERLQEITEKDAEAEGESWSSAGDGENYDVYSAIENYANLWDSLNAKRGFGWNGNWWVWVIGFRLLSARLK